MINPTDKIIFDYYAQKGRVDFAPMEIDDAYDITHYLYRGRTIGQVSDKVQKILDVPNIQFLGMACKGSVQRSIEVASVISNFVPDEDLNDPESEARLNNQLQSPRMRKLVDDLLELQDAADELVQGDEDMSGIFAGTGNQTKSGFNDDLRHRIMKGTPNIRNILKSYGALKELIGKAKRTKIFPSQTVIKDVKLGDDLSKLLTDELVLLALPELQHLANLKFVNKELLQYHLEEEKPTGKGAVAIYVDTSESMRYSGVEIDGVGISRYTASAGVCLAIIAELETQGREYEVFGFNEEVWSFGTSKNSNEAKLALFTGEPYGGTSLQRVINHMESLPKDYDALVLSDAEFEPGIRMEKSEARRGLIEFGGGGFDSSKFDMAIKIKKMEDFESLTDFVV